MKVKLDKSESHSVVSYFLQPHGLYSPWNSPSQNTAVRSLFLLQGIFPTQESNPGLLHCRQILYKLSHQGNPRILEWVAYAFCSRSCQIRNQGWTRVSWTAGEFFTNWATREGKEHVSKNTHTHTHTHTHTMEYNTIIKRNEIFSFASMWVDLETVIQSEVRKRKANILSVTCGI